MRARNKEVNVKLNAELVKLRGNGGTSQQELEEDELYNLKVHILELSATTFSK